MDGSERDTFIIIEYTWYKDNNLVVVKMQGAYLSMFKLKIVVQ